GQFVADERLHRVVEVRDVHLGGANSGWDRVTIAVHRLEDGYVLAEVHASALPARASRNAFGRAIDVEDRTAPDLLEHAAHLRQQRLAIRANHAWRDVEPTGFRFSCESVEHRRVTVHGCGLQGVESVHDLGKRERRGYGRHGYAITAESPGQ